MDNNTKKGKNSDVEVGLIVVSVAVLIAFIICMVVNAEGTLNTITNFFNTMINALGPFFLLRCRQ